MEETVSDLSGNVLRSSEFAYGTSDDDVLAEFRTQSGTTVASYYLKDRLGSASAVTDSAGNVLEEYRYSAFGSPYRKLPDGTWEALGAETETLSGTVRPESLTERLYAGREWDSETGLHHYRARAYSPELGRFLQRDPAWQSDQANPYAYVRNDPENFTDPTGGVANFVAGAAANVAMGAAFEYVSAWREGREFSYSAKDALADAVSGAAGVGIAQKAARLGKLAKPLFETVANASANTLSAVIRSDCPKGRMAAGDIAGVFGSQLVSQIAMRAQGAVVKKGFGFVKKTANVHSVVAKKGAAGGLTAGKRFTPQQRKSTFEEYDGKCAACGTRTHLEGKSSPAKAETDHVIPRKEGGNTMMENAQNLCRTCNRAKGAKSMEEFLKKNFNNE